MSENPVVRLIPELARYRLDGVPDGELVERYARERDNDAFAELVRRHGGMVLAVCRRILRNAADADDAFQAAFLVLARRAAAIQPPGAVGPWLHGVAFRTAREAYRRAARRRHKESRVIPREETAELLPDDFRPILDAELDRLPRKYAEVLVLCDMEDRTRRDVAALLSVPEGTIASRLARAREMLAVRLSRRGFGVSASVLATTLASDVQGAPPSMVQAAATFASGNAASASVVELAQAVLSSFSLRLKLAIAFIAVAALGLSGWAAEAAIRSQPHAPVVQALPETKLEPLPNLDPLAQAKAQLTGSWRIDSGTKNGQPLTPWEKQGIGFDFGADGKLALQRIQINDLKAFTWAVEKTATPNVVVLSPPDGNAESRIRIPFEVKDDVLTLSWSEAAGPRRGYAAASYRLTLSRLAAPSSTLKLAMVPSPQNAVGANLVGTWELDDELNRKLGGADPKERIQLVFTKDETVANEVPENFRELFAGKRIYLAGRMSIFRPIGEPTICPYLLIEHLGNPMLVYFIPKKSDEWSCEEAATVGLLSGAKPEQDLLFIKPFENAKQAPAGGFRRAEVKK